jgi:hypothetical protein
LFKPMPERRVVDVLEPEKHGDDAIPDGQPALACGRHMKVRIVVAVQNAGWVIGKMGQRLAAALQELGVQASVSDEPDASADVNHWMSFAFADGCSGTLNTMFVTHADDPYKLRLIGERLRSAIQLALCMSPHAAGELAALGVPADRLWHVLPAMDQVLAPRRVCVGITTRLYDDGRKREALLVRLAGRMPLDAFHFKIFGAGWEAVIPHLQRAGAQVEYDPGTDDWRGDYARIQEAIPGFDYYLYTGMDEGSLGTLDAASAGVKTIVTAQGFHLSLPGGITHPFVTYEELESVFRGLAHGREVQHQALKAWNWQAYAREHIGVWQAMLAHRGGAVPAAELEAATRRETGSLPTAAPMTQGRIASRDWRFYLRLLKRSRVRGAIARLRWLQPLRKWIGR